MSRERLKGRIDQLNDAFGLVACDQGNKSGAPKENLAAEPETGSITKIIGKHNKFGSIYIFGTYEKPPK
jgi:hypothetical protein